VWIGDPMAWNMPDQMTATLTAIQARWPRIKTFHLHLHDARGTALLSAYQALQVLSPEATLILDSAIGGMGGCPYGGHGRMTRMIPTEDLVDLLNELGIPTGVNLDLLIEAAHLAERVVGHSLWGHVSKAGARPRGDRLFSMDMPFVETEEQAQHFRLGPKAYQGAPSPWRNPIASPARP
jgi:hydroxymethylglutaryl-CoA lyase